MVIDKGNSAAVAIIGLNVLGLDCLGTPIKSAKLKLSKG